MNYECGQCEQADRFIDGLEGQLSSANEEVAQLKAEIASLTASLEGAREEIAQLEKKEDEA